MTKFDIWFRVYDDYHVIVEADSLADAQDRVIRFPRQWNGNAESNFRQRTWLGGNTEIQHSREYEEKVND